MNIGKTREKIDKLLIDYIGDVDDNYSELWSLINMLVEDAYYRGLKKESLEN